MASEWALMRALAAVDVLGPKPGESWSKTVEKIATALDEARREGAMQADQELYRRGLQVGAELERDELMENHQALGREYEAQGRVADKLQADLDAALVLCVASDWDVKVLGAGYEPEVYKAHAHVLPLLEKRREGRG